MPPPSLDRVNPPSNPTKDEIKHQAEHLVQQYPNDLSLEDLQEELRHFVKFSQSIGATRNKGLALLNLIYEKKLEGLYPQVCICFRIFLSIPVSVASGEGSFSKIALIKNRLRSTMTQDRLSSLMTLSIEHELARQIDYDYIIDQFATEKARKISF